jgi:hypothetical protein
VTLDICAAEGSRPAAGWNPRLAEGTGFSREYARPSYRLLPDLLRFRSGRRDLTMQQVATGQKIVIKNAECF